MPVHGQEHLHGDAPRAVSQFDIEHIIPFSRSLDNSFANKTLSDVRENRDIKQNRTPFEAYSGDETKWHAILFRAKRFRSSSAHAKLRSSSNKSWTAISRRGCSKTRGICRGLLPEILDFFTADKSTRAGKAARAGRPRSDYRLSPRRMGA